MKQWKNGKHIVVLEYIRLAIIISKYSMPFSLVSETICPR